jgi:hypothetical protein
MGLAGIGRVTLMDETALPWHLNGFLWWLRSLAVPVIGASFVQHSIQNRDRTNLFGALTGLLVVGFLGSLFGLSRSILVYTVVPSVLYMMLHPDAAARSMGLKYLLLLGGVTVFMVQIVSIMRNVGFANNTLSLGSLGQLSEIDSSYGDVSLSKILPQMLQLFINRQGGAQELALIIGSSAQSTERIWQYFISDPSFEFMRELFAIPEASGIGVFGAGFPGMSWLYFGNNMLIVILGTAIQIALVMGLEEIFLMRGWRAGAVFIGIYFAARFWYSFYWEMFWKGMVMYILTLLLLEWMASSRHIPGKQKPNKENFIT